MSESDRLILDQFGKALMEEVRDRTSLTLQDVISGNMANKELKALGQLLQSQHLTPEQFEVVRRVLMYAVDLTMAVFLQFLDANEIGVLFRDASGQVHDIQAMSDGLAGEPYTEEGWIARFSNFEADTLKEKLT